MRTFLVRLAVAAAQCAVFTGVVTAVYVLGHLAVYRRLPDWK